MRVSMHVCRVCVWVGCTVGMWIWARVPMHARTCAHTCTACACVGTTWPCACVPAGGWAVVPVSECVYLPGACVDTRKGAHLLGSFLPSPGLMPWDSGALTPWDGYDLVPPSPARSCPPSPCRASPWAPPPHNSPVPAAQRLRPRRALGPPTCPAPASPPPALYL